MWWESLSESQRHAEQQSQVNVKGNKTEASYSRVSCPGKVCLLKNGAAR